MNTGSRQSIDFSSINKSIPELIAFLRHALRESHFKEVEDILVEREKEAQLEIQELRILNKALEMKCEVLSLDCGRVSGGGGGGGESDRSPEEIFHQLVGGLGKGEKESDEVRKLKREKDELKRENDELKRENNELKIKNVKLGKLILDCVDNYMVWNDKFSSLWRDVEKVKTLEAVGLDGISNNKSGESGENKESFMKNDDNGVLFGEVCRKLDFEVDENDPVGMAPAKEKETEVPVDQGSGIVPVKRAVEIIDIDDDLLGASCEGNTASQKSIDGEHSNQSCASKGRTGKGYSLTNVVDLEKDSIPTSRIDGLDVQTDGEHVNKGEESTQKVISPSKVSESAASTPGVSNAKKVAAKSKGYSLTNVVDLEKDSIPTIRIDGLDVQTDGEHVNKGEESTQKVISPSKVSESAASTPGVSNAKKVAAKSQHNVVTLRQCDERNAKRRCLSELPNMSESRIARAYGSEGRGGSYLSADHPKKRRQWKFFADMHADLSNDEVCLSAVCALYRQEMSAFKHIEGPGCRGFSSNWLDRGIQLAEFLIDEDPHSRLRKTEKELRSQFTNGLEDCRCIAREHSKQLFEIYQKKLDEFYPEA